MPCRTTFTHTILTRKKEMETIVQKLENYYNQYLNLTSDVMLNLNTDTLFSRIESLPQCKMILDELIRNNPIEDEEICNLNGSEIHDHKKLFETRGANYYVAFCLQWYYYQKNHVRFLMNTYADNAKRWLTKTDKDTENIVRIFKTDAIRPIVDYIISQIKEHNLILYYLDRYKSRVERYTHGLLADKNELGLQKDFALYLFDQELPFFQEPNLGHGRPDYVIDLECNDKPFVIEIKRSDVLSSGEIDESLRQLKAYLDRFPSYGCLYIFTKDTNYVNYSYDIDEKLIIRCVYLGDKAPSQL